MIAIAPRDLALLIGINVIWGLNLVFSKYGVEQIPPMLFTFLRFLGVALILLPSLRLHPGQMSALTVAALLGGALHFSLSFAGLKIANSVSSVAIASQLGVPFTTLLSVALLGEVVRWRRWTGIALSFAGVFIMAFDPQVIGRWQGLALVIASAFVGALGLIAIKRLSGFRPHELQGWIALLSLPLLFVNVLLEGPDLRALADASAGAWVALAFSIVGASLVAHSGYYFLIQRYPVTSVAPLTVLSPIFSVIFGVLLLGDPLTTQMVAGSVFTLAGVVIITLRERRIVETGT